MRYAADLVAVIFYLRTTLEFGDKVQPGRCPPSLEQLFGKGGALAFPFLVAGWGAAYRLENKRIPATFDHTVDDAGQSGDRCGTLCCFRNRPNSGYAAARTRGVSGRPNLKMIFRSDRAEV